MLEERVNIQYSIDMDELPQEVQRLIEKACCSLEDACTADMSRLVKSEDFLSLSTLTGVEQLRKKLSAVDYILNDVSQIVNVFISFKVQENTQANQAPQATRPEEESAMPTMAQMPAEMPDLEAFTEHAVKNLDVDQIQDRLDELRQKQSQVE